MKKEKPKHGGSRKGAGRKLKYKEETSTVSFRLPLSLIPVVKKYVIELLSKHKPSKKMKLSFEYGQLTDDKK